MVLNLVRAFHQLSHGTPPLSLLDNKRVIALESKASPVWLNEVIILNLPFDGVVNGFDWVSDFHIELETGIPGSPWAPAGPGSPWVPKPGCPWGPSGPILECAILYSLSVLLTIVKGPAIFDKVAFFLSSSINVLNIVVNL